MSNWSFSSFRMTFKMSLRSRTMMMWDLQPADSSHFYLVCEECLLRLKYDYLLVTVEFLVVSSLTLITLDCGPYMISTCIYSTCPLFICQQTHNTSSAFSQSWICQSVIHKQKVDKQYVACLTVGFWHRCRHWTQARWSPIWVVILLLHCS